MKIRASILGGKIFSLMLVLCLFYAYTQNFVAAFAGGMHLKSTTDLIESILHKDEICKVLGENQQKFFNFLSSLTSDQIEYIESGSICADIGRFLLDEQPGSENSGTNLFPASDELKFISRMEKNVDNTDKDKSLKERLFILGMMIHYLQDKFMGKFSEEVFGAGHKTSYFDYAKYEKWRLNDCGGIKICTAQLNSENFESENFKFDFGPIADTIAKIYPLPNIFIGPFLYSLSKGYYSNSNEKFLKIPVCTDLLVRTYNSFPEAKNLSESISSEFINKSIDLVIGSHAILSAIPVVSLLDEQKGKIGEAYNNFQSNIMIELGKMDLNFCFASF